MLRPPPDSDSLRDLDRLTKSVLSWVNDRRAYAELQPLDDLCSAGFSDDPILASCPPGTIWVGGKLQYFFGAGIVQVDVEDFVHRWRHEWEAGKHPEYD